MRVAIAQSVGKGIAAGLAGTAAMTVSSTIEAKIRKRAPSLAPAQAAEKVLGIERFKDEAAENRFSSLVHWSYGAGWGAFRGLLAAAGLSSRTATAAQYTAMWGGAQVMLPALEVAPPVTMWGRNEIAIDAWHHLVYAVTTDIAFEWLDARNGHDG